MLRSLLVACLLVPATLAALPDSPDARDGLDALAWARGVMEEQLPAAAAVGVDRSATMRGLAASQAISDILAAPRPGTLFPLLSAAASNYQASILGEALPNLPVPVPRSPSDAATALVQRLGGPSEQLGDFARLDALPEPTRGALAATIEAFLAMDDASRVATADATNVDAALMLAARAAFIDAVADLREAAPVTTAASCTPIVVAPALAIDLDGCDWTYTDDVVLSIDFGGDDAYHNNAGGNADGPGNVAACQGTAVRPAAALLDFGGSDQYGDPDRGRICGANGGAFLGIGFLADFGDAHDSYHAAGLGVNGGAYIAGVGFLYDEGGNDVYTLERIGGSGGASGGIGTLIDEAGNDWYESARVAVQGGARDGGIGFLLDAAGDDHYLAAGFGVNGGGQKDGVGFLYDGAGDDQYVTRGAAVNGGSNSVAEGRGHWDSTSGFLYDVGGNDLYRATDFGANGGATGGSGFLLDGAGDDRYEALDRGTNGGAGSRSAGALLDRRGNDSYTALDRGANGASNQGVGLLYDATGTDWYQDLQGGTGMDRSVVPKGLLGAQIDDDFDP